MKILFAAGEKTKKINYENVLKYLGYDYDTALEGVNVNDYEGLLVPGGADINPGLYGQEINGSVDIDYELDKAQWELISLFVEAEKPILGICRGCQILNAFFGGTLYQHLPTAETHVNKNIDTEKLHDAKTKEGSLLRNLYGEDCRVNTFHHQGCDQIGKGLKVTMTAPDGVVEGLEHESLPIVAVQWHPERMAADMKVEGACDGDKIFKAVFGK